IPEIEAAYGGCWHHCQAFSKPYAGVLFYIEQFPDREFFGVIRLCRVSRCRADTSVLLPDQLFVAEVFRFGITPEFLAHLFMQQFSERFSEPVCQSFQHNSAIIVMIFFKTSHMFVDANTGCYSKGADIVGRSAVIFRFDKISQGNVILAGRFFCLLSYRM